MWRRRVGLEPPRVASHAPQTCSIESSYKCTLQQCLLLQRDVFLTRFLGLLKGAELEDASRILFGHYRPPTGTVSQESFEV